MAGCSSSTPGASTIRDEGNRGDAIACERLARPSLSALAHPTLTQLLEAANIAMATRWCSTGSTPCRLGVSTSRSQRLSDLSLCRRVNAVQLIYDFHVYGPITVGWR